MDLGELTERVENISAGYAFLHNVERTDDWLLLKLTEEVGELVQAHLTASGQSRDRGLDESATHRATEDELADVVSMCLVYAHRKGIDVEQAIERKWFRHEQRHRELGFGSTTS